MNPSIFPLLIVMGSLAIPAGAAEQHMMQPLVPADKLAERAHSRPRCRVLRRSSSRAKRSITARVAASTVMGKTETAMDRWRPN